jgi:hypothetical protein
MIRMSARHNVSDYYAWRKVHDDFDTTRRSLGVKDAAVYRAADNPNDITVTHDFESLGAAQAFAGSTELREAMGNAGVASEPSIWFGSPA